MPLANIEMDSDIFLKHIGKLKRGNMKHTKNKIIITALSSLLALFFLAAYVYAETVQRSNFTVGNLSCTSCLATIEAELKRLQGTVGMDADLRAGRVTVDHFSSLEYEKIAKAITSLGYPAAMEWTGTLPEQYSNRFAAQSRYRSGCSSGGCGTSGGAGAGPTAWKAAPADGTISRTTMQVSNLSCTSCLTNIAAALSKFPDTYGMNSYLSRGVVIVDHATAEKNDKIAATISGLGYPARVLATNELPAQKAFSASPGNRSSNQVRRAGGGCNSGGPCNATSASWKKLYNRYVSKTESK
jgi:copper chaperone CopZ